LKVIGLSLGCCFCAVAGTPAALRGAGPLLPEPILTPAVGARAVCADTPLSLDFPAPPGLGSSGRIRIFDAVTGKLAAWLDVAAGVATQTIGGIPGFHYYPVRIFDRLVDIRLPDGTLSPSTEYYVLVDSGALTEEGAPWPGISDPQTWRFTTKALPRPGTTRLVVAAGGDGDFCTLQGAIDFIPPGNTVPTTVLLKSGLYSEIVAFGEKNEIEICGEDRRRTVLSYPNNAVFNPGGGNPYGRPGGNPSEFEYRTGAVYHRGVFLAHRTKHLTLKNLTVENTTPQGGLQAEAIILNGLSNSRAVVEDVDLRSFQDTLQINGQAYIHRCRIEGDVDFMWGNGPSFFEDCVCTALRAGGYYTQIRNPPTNHGFVYLHCVFDGSSGCEGNFLSRIDPARFPASEMVLLDCMLTGSVAPDGWQVGPTHAHTVEIAAGVHFWEARSRDATGKSVPLALRHRVSRILAEPADAPLIAAYSDPSYVLGEKWDPRNAGDH